MLTKNVILQLCVPTNNSLISLGMFSQQLAWLGAHPEPSVHFEGFVGRGGGRLALNIRYQSAAAAALFGSGFKYTP